MCLTVMCSQRVRSWDDVNIGVFEKASFSWGKKKIGLVDIYLLIWKECLLDP